MVVYIIEAKYITRGVVIVVTVLSPNQIVTLEIFLNFEIMYIFYYGSKNDRLD